MPKKTLCVTLLSLFLAIFYMSQETAAQTAGKTAKNVPEIAYTVSMPEPWTHLLKVEMRMKWNEMPAAAELKLPVWTPGSYLVREYARHVQDFAASNAAGRPLSWQKINKNTWQIQTAGVKEIVVKYAVYSNELTVRTNELNDEHGFWNNAALLMFPKDKLNAPSTVTVEPYGNWKIATGLAKTDRPNTFYAENFDILYDSPFEVSNFKETTFAVHGVPHRLVITGDGNYDLKQIAEDTTKIANEGVKIFGELPIKDYTIIVNLRGGGGLEHLNSTALQWSRFGFKPRMRYIGFLNLVAHEYFHLWNVKRIRPDALGPFDYENENYTRLLWFAEGGTAYYESVLLRRAGLITDKELLATKAGMIEQLQSRPGRFQTSLEEASLDAWIKYYRQDENSVNNQVSYYDKGEIVAMMLDLTIRNASGGGRSLDDVMRYLYTEFYKKDRNFSPADLQQAAEKMAGKSLDEFFAKYVRGREEIDYAGIFKPLGIDVQISKPNEKKAYLGANLAEENGRLTVRSVPADTPAYQQGLNYGDQIVAIDGNRATLSFLQSYISELSPGDKVKLTIFRFDQLREMTITLGGDTRGVYKFVPFENADEKQKELYRYYLQADLK